MIETIPMSGKPAELDPILRQQLLDKMRPWKPMKENQDERRDPH